MNEIQAVGAEAVNGPLETGPPEKSRPWLYSLLIAPMAVQSNAVVQGGLLAYVLSQQGVSSGGRSHIISLLSLPTSLYFLWSPITDFLLQRRTWLLVGGFVGGALFAAGFQMGLLSSRSAMLVMFLGACFAQLVVASAGGMMGAIQVERSRRVASAFYQGGSMGIGALGAYVLIGLSDKLSQHALGLLAGAMIALPALFALMAPKQEVIADGEFGATMRRVWTECKTTFGNRRAIPYTACMIFPMASGAAVGLLSGFAKSYGVGGEQVAWMNGLAGGALFAVGALAVTLIPARTRAAVGYMSVALVNAATLCVLWLGPMRPGTYYLGVTLYLFTMGSCNAAFTAVVLEFMGNSGKTGSGRYSIINSLGNVPVLYMIELDGWGGDRWGARGLVGTEAVVGGLGAIMLLAYFLLNKESASGRTRTATA